MNIKPLIILFLLVNQLLTLPAQEYQFFKQLTGHQSKLTFVLFRNEDNLLASGDMKGKIAIWDINQGKSIKWLNGHNKQITHLEFNKKGNLMASASYDGTVKIWDLSKSEIIRNIQIPAGVPYADVAGNEPTFLSLHPSEDIIFFGGYDSKVYKYDLKKGSQEVLYEDKIYGITCGRLSEDHNKLIFGAGFKIYMYDLIKKEISNLFSPEDSNSNDEYICEVAQYKDKLAVWYYGGNVKIFDLKDNSLSYEWNCTKEKGTSNLSFSQNGNLLLTGNLENTTKLWDIKQQKLQQQLKGHKKRTTTFSFSFDDLFIATGSDDQTIIIWKKDLQQIEKENESQIPDLVEGRKVDVQAIFKSKKDKEFITFWDNSILDGDIISVYLNEIKILNNHKLTKEKKKIELKLKDGINVLSIYAHNLGEIPPNTIGVIRNIKGKKTHYTFRSDKYNNATIIFKKD